VKLASCSSIGSTLYLACIWGVYVVYIALLFFAHERVGVLFLVVPFGMSLRCDGCTCRHVSSGSCLAAAVRLRTSWCGLKIRRRVARVWWSCWRGVHHSNLCCNTECCSVSPVSTVGAGTCATRLPANFSVSYITRRIVNPPDTCCTPGCHSGELYMAHLVRRSVLRADSVVSPLVSLREPRDLYSSARVE